MFKDKPVSNQIDLEYFTIFDSKVGVYRAPMASLNRFTMLREIETLMSDPQQQRAEICMYPEDFSLFKVAEFNKTTGRITAVNHEHIANLHDLKAMVTRKQTLNLEANRSSQQQLNAVPNGAAIEADSPSAYTRN